MGWFARFLEGIRRFMYGRYGVDQLSFVGILLYMVLIIIAQLFRWPILTGFSMLILVLCFFRIFSRNTGKRYQENEKFLQLTRPLKNWCVEMNKRLRDRKTHRYFRCPNCKNMLRVPKGKGKICITCPVCRKEFIKKT